MGNSTSILNNKKDIDILKSSSGKNKSIKDLEESIDMIFIKYIQSLDFKEFASYQSTQKYDDLILLTNEFLTKSLEKLSFEKYQKLNRLYRNKQIYALKNIKTDEKMVQTKKDIINRLTKFYTNLFNIYIAIIATNDPIYMFINNNGDRVEFRLSEYEKYMGALKDREIVMIKEFSPQSICNSRMKILKDSISGEHMHADIDAICSLHETNKDNDKFLTDIPGIKELEKLFHLDEDFNSNNNNTSEKQRLKELYDEKLDVFYSSFTGKTQRPQHIDTFDKILINQINKKSKYCKEPEKKEFKQITKVDEEFIEVYSKIIRDMNINVVKHKKKLVNILKKIFNTRNGKLSINKDLKDKDVEKINVKTINIISNMYLLCNKYYLLGLLLFEKIYKNKKKDNSIREEILEQREKNNIEVIDLTYNNPTVINLTNENNNNEEWLPNRDNNTNKETTSPHIQPRFMHTAENAIEIMMKDKIPREVAERMVKEQGKTMTQVLAEEVKEMHPNINNEVRNINHENREFEIYDLVFDYIFDKRVIDELYENSIYENDPETKFKSILNFYNDRKKLINNFIIVLQKQEVPKDVALNVIITTIFEKLKDKYINDNRIIIDTDNGDTKESSFNQELMKINKLINIKLREKDIRIDNDDTREFLEMYSSESNPNENPYLQLPQKPATNQSDVRVKPESNQRVPNNKVNSSEVRVKTESNQPVPNTQRNSSEANTNPDPQPTVNNSTRVSVNIEDSNSVNSVEYNNENIKKMYNNL